MFDNSELSNNSDHSKDSEFWELSDNSANCFKLSENCELSEYSENSDHFICGRLAD